MAQFSCVLISSLALYIIPVIHDGYLDRKTITLDKLANDTIDNVKFEKTMALGGHSIEEFKEWLLDGLTLKVAKTADKVVKAKSRCEKAKKAKEDAEREVAWAKRLCKKAKKVKIAAERDLEKANSRLERSNHDLVRHRRKGQKLSRRLEEGDKKNIDRVQRFLEEAVEELAAWVVLTNERRSGASSSSVVVPKDVSSDDDDDSSSGTCQEGSDSS